MNIGKKGFGFIKCDEFDEDIFFGIRDLSMPLKDMSKLCVRGNKKQKMRVIIIECSPISASFCRGSSGYCKRVRSGASPISVAGLPSPDKPNATKTNDFLGLSSQTLQKPMMSLGC